MDGVLVIDKPQGLTSHDVVNRVRRILGIRSVGHLGALDPAATGVLPLVLGSFTRLAQFYVHSEKTYEGVIRFGFSTDTYDADGEPTSTPQSIVLNPDEMSELAAKFCGKIEQMPPPFSAKKIGGVPAYKLARKQREVHLKPVQVEIKEFAILEVASDSLTFRARVGSGTYLRSIAHDMGQKLGCGAHLASLRRTAVAEFLIDDARKLDQLETAMRQGTSERVLEQLFVHPRKLASHLPSVTATEENVAIIRSGRAVNLPEMSRAPLVKVFFGQRELVAIATRIAGTLFHARIVLTTHPSSREHASPGQNA
ncbi:MAG: tRNA pseudouridine(55) synthase TruB [Chthoniobacterales bacterium]